MNKNTFCIIGVPILVMGLMSFSISRVVWAHNGGSIHGSHKPGGHTGATIDPVCGMIISDIKKAPSEKYKGQVYYFCSENCRKTFMKSPASFIEGLLKR